METFNRKEKKQKKKYSQPLLILTNQGFVKDSFLLLVTCKAYFIGLLVASH